MWLFLLFVKKFMEKKLVKIKESYEFRRAYAKGKCYVCPFMVVYCFKNRYNKTRLGITAGKKIGNAVKRNRAKRVITAAVRECLPQINSGYDFIIVARQRILSVKSNVASAALLKLLKSANLCSESTTNE